MKRIYHILLLFVLMLLAQYGRATAVCSVDSNEFECAEKGLFVELSSITEILDVLSLQKLTGEVELAAADALLMGAAESADKLFRRADQLQQAVIRKIASE